MLKLNLILIIILAIGLLKLRSVEHYQNQFCILSNIDNKTKFTPINMIINDIKPFKLTTSKGYLNMNIVLSLEEIKTAIKAIKIVKPSVNFKEAHGVKYNLVDPPKKYYIPGKFMSKFPNKLFNMISLSLNKILTSKESYCNSNTICKLIIKDSRILKLGKYKQNHSVEGQLMLTLENRNMDILFRYVISDLNGFSVHHLALEGYDISKDMNNLVYDNVNIYSEPIVNKYRGNKTYLMSSNEKLLTSVTIKPKLDERLKYKCYGKTEFNKIDCESKYDSSGKLNSQVGIWDKICVKNTDCPFYKANKNFKNNLGGCVNNKCELPLGLSTKGPTKPRNIKYAVCSNCKTGVNCCIDQKDKKKYPFLKSPDYRYKNDENIRMTNNL